MIGMLIRIKESIIEIVSMSFKEAVWQPVGRYYKPDNGYWTKAGNRNGFWYRFIALSAVVTLSVAYALIARNQSPWQLLVKNYQEMSAGAPMLLKDFPMRLVAYPRLWASQYHKATQEDIAGALNDPMAKIRLESLIKESYRTIYTEVGGAVFIKDGGMTFWLLDNPNLPIAMEIMGSLRQDDSRVFTTYNQYKQLIQNKYGYEYPIRKMGAVLEREPGNILFTRKILDLFAFYSAFDYEVDFDQLLELFYDGEKGEYVGNFHVHQLKDRISPQDLEASKHDDKVVPTDLGGGQIKVFWLRDGKIFFEKVIT